ncbi:MAG: type 2 lantipeptide synthetase LanM [Propionivibrio sp.]|uniref:Type 2 lantipeptide synthetase LanM n=1 Tax=Candidatus Propionivibrio dominans TaxID=2954373 RepID=A0A9D7IC34_9RHOO|nr:type 2 lantipeptide synthetase LanM [Candidatus Propionivibrio dominans]
MRSFNRSVSRSGLLPLMMGDAYGRNFEDVSGLGGIADFAGKPVGTIDAINTDTMRIVPHNEAARRRPNNPFPDDAGDPAGYLSAIETGFSRLHELLVHERELLLAPDGPLRELRMQLLRFIFRSTSSYAAILERSIRAECLSDGARRSIELDAVSRAFLHGTGKPRFWPILAAELAALERLDVPVFMTTADSTDLDSEDMSPLPGCLEDPAFVRVLATVQGLDDADRTFQLRVIHGMFQTRGRSGHSAAHCVCTPTDSEPGEPVTCESAWREATAIADQLVGGAIDCPDNGAAYWLGLKTRDEKGFRQFRPIGDALFDGRMGIALFLAAMAAASADSTYRQVALLGIEPVLKLARTQDREGRRRYIHSIGIGGLTGIGSTVYGLACIGKLVAAPEFTTHAAWFARGLTPEVIGRDQQLDIVNGTAGALLALISLFNQTGDRELLERAEQCGEHLLNCREPTTCGHRAWRSPANTAPLAGFSHGASGIGLALLSLFARTARPEFRDAALEGFAYERSLFDPHANNWRDLRGGTAPYMASWCHGAPGIGLARVAALQIYPDEPLADDLAMAISASRGLSRAPVDHFCCGEFGRVEFLTVALEETAARLRANRVLADKRTTGSYRLFTDIHEASNPGLFQGLAGIGYGWLRLARPRAFPCVLTLE